MDKTKNYDKWMGILSISVIAIVAIIFVSITSGAHLAKGTYAIDYYYCNSSDEQQYEGDTPTYDCACYYSSQDTCQSQTNQKCSSKFILMYGLGTCWAPTGESITCSAGQYLKDGSCKDCEIGFACSNSTRKQCNGTNEYQNQAKQSSCKTCSSGYVPNEDHTSCGPVTTCVAGTYYAGQGRCEKCIANYYCPGVVGYNGDSSRAGIFECPNNGKSSAGAKSASECTTTADTTTCAAGTYYAGQGRCETCVANYYCPGVVGYNGDSSRAGIFECPDNKKSSAGAKKESDCKADSSSGPSSPSTPDTPSTPSNPSTPDTPTTDTGKCYVKDHQYVWATSQPSNSGLVSSITTADKCKGCETGYAKDSNNKCVAASTGKCYVKDHQYVWATSQPANSGLVNSITTADKCKGCETGYAADSNNKCVKPDSPSGGGSSDSPSNPQTGAASVILIWMIGLMAIGYSVWYFKRSTNN